MLVKFEIEDSEAAQLKAFYGEKTVSACYRRAGFDVRDQAAQLRLLRQRIEILEAKLASRDQAIDGARAAAALLLEKVGQKEMF